MKISFKAKSFKKMECPNQISNNEQGRNKFVCYAQCSTIPDELSNWMGTNPREQKMTTNVARDIEESLEKNSNFHELNRGILLSTESIAYNNQTGIVEIELSNPEIHGNIDGGHTLRAILEANKANTLSEDRYVFLEVFTGLDSPVELAKARNTSVQVDLKSIEELNKSFDTLKLVFEKLPFSNRIQYKMNEFYNDNVVSIDVREIIAITIMFSQAIYPIKNSKGNISDIQPIQCYSGKEASLKKFLNLKKEARDNLLLNMKNVIPDIFKLYEEIESTFAQYALKAGKRYGTRKYSKFDNEKIIGKSVFEEKDLKYMVPRGLMYPLVGAFRSIIEVDNVGNYSWKKDPITVWKNIGSKLAAIILDEKMENPDALAKNQNLWSNLFKEVFIYAYL